MVGEPPQEKEDEQKCVSHTESRRAKKKKTVCHFKQDLVVVLVVLVFRKLRRFFPSQTSQRLSHIARGPCGLVNLVFGSSEGHIYLRDDSAFFKLSVSGYIHILQGCCERQNWYEQLSMSYTTFSKINHERATRRFQLSWGGRDVGRGRGGESRRVGEITRKEKINK